MKLSKEIKETRSLAVLATVWVTLNCAVIAIDILPAEHGVPSTTRPSRLAQTLFEAHGSPGTSSADLAGCRLRFRLLAPPQNESGQHYPLLVFLHGAGERGADNERQLCGLPQQMCNPEWRRRFPCYVLAPQCPDGRYWSEYMADLQALVEHVRTRRHVDERRVYLTGLSMGGYGSWELVARRPDLLAAVVPICGGGDPQWAKRLAGVPIWAIHGAEDDVVPAEQSRSMVRAIREAGGRPKYTEIPRVGHDSWTVMYSNPNGVVRWMFQQHRDGLETSTRAQSDDPQR